MYRNRIIPVLTLRENYLVKTRKFKKDRYIGDPINAVRIFNDKEADELFIIDMDATRKKRIQYDLLKNIADEAFMPLGYAGGIKDIEQIKRLFATGYEKIGLNTSARKNKKLIQEASRRYGAQSIIGIIDIKKDLWGNYKVYDHVKKSRTKEDPYMLAKEIEEAGCGEIIINNVDKDGTMEGYDLEIIKKMAAATKIPLIAIGGAGNLDHLQQAIRAGVSATAAGSMFVFYGPHKAVLINYPCEEFE